MAAGSATAEEGRGDWGSEEKRKEKREEDKEEGKKDKKKEKKRRREGDWPELGLPVAITAWPVTRGNVATGEVPGRGGGNGKKVMRLSDGGGMVMVRLW